MKVGEAGDPPAAIIDVGRALFSVVGTTGAKVADPTGIAYIVVNAMPLVGATTGLDFTTAELDMLHRGEEG